MTHGLHHTQGQESATQQAHKQAIWQAQARQAVLVANVAQAAQGVPTTASGLRGVWMASQCSRPHHTGQPWGRFLRHVQPATVVHVMSQPQERARAQWFEYYSWTAEDIYEEITYITYE